MDNTRKENITKIITVIIGAFIFCFVVNFVVFCVVLANFLKNPCHNTIFSNMKIKDCSRHRIIPAPAPWMAAQQPAHSQI